jgi:integrase
MARNIRSKLENRSTRLTFKRVRKPTWERIGSGVWLGYRRLKLNGRWVLRVVSGGSEWTKGFADADDHENANGVTVLNFFQAQQKARELAGAGKDGTATAHRPITVSDAVDAYERDLAARGADTKNAEVIRYHLKDAKGLANIAVSALVATDFKAWRASFNGASSATVNRTNNSLRAALNQAAELYDLTNTKAWRVGFMKRIKGADRSRNVILPNKTIAAIIRAAYSKIGPEFGLLVEVAAQTGARYSQLVRLTIGNVHIKGNPRLMIPVSKKGTGEKAITHRPVPITADLALRLPIKGRQPHALLLTKAGVVSADTEPRAESGSRGNHSVHAGDTPWGINHQLRPFEQVIEHLKNDPGIKNARFPVSMYALRHSSIARQLLDGVNPKIVADNHDTSIVMIQKNYSEFITDHSDAISRKTLSAFASNVVSLPSARVG